MTRPLSLLLASLLLAQTSSVSASGRAEQLSEQHEYLVSAREYIRCQMIGNQRKIARALAVLPASSEEASVFRSLNAIDCADKRKPGVLRIPALSGQLRRGIVAEIMLLKDFSAMGVPKGNRIARIVEPVAEATIASLPNEQKAQLAMISVGECAVHAEPEAAFSLFRTPPGSAEEGAAVRSLIPALERCLPGGGQVRLDNTTVRSFLAEAAYRVSATAAAKVLN